MACGHDLHYDVRRGRLGVHTYTHPQLDLIVWRVNQILLGPEVSLRGLDRSVSQEKLDLFKLAPGRPAQLCAGTTQVIGRDQRPWPSPRTVSTFAKRSSRTSFHPTCAASGNGLRRALQQ